MSEAWHEVRLNGDPNCRCAVSFAAVSSDGRCFGHLDRCCRHQGTEAAGTAPGLWLLRRFFYLYGFVVSALQISWYLGSWWCGTP